MLTVLAVVDRGVSIVDAVDYLNAALDAALVEQGMTGWVPVDGTVGVQPVGCGPKLAGRSRRNRAQPDRASRRFQQGPVAARRLHQLSGPGETLPSADPCIRDQGQGHPR